MANRIELYDRPNTISWQPGFDAGNGTLRQMISGNDGATWSLSANFGGTAPAAGSAIANVRQPSTPGDPNSEDMWVYYVGSNNAIWQWKWAGGHWVNSQVTAAGEVAPGSGLSVPATSPGQTLDTVSVCAPPVRPFWPTQPVHM